MKATLRTGAQTTAWLVAFVVAVIGISALSYFLYATFAPRYTAVDYKVYKQSQQYNDGMAIDLEHYQEAYNEPGVTQAARDNIRSIVRHQYASYDDSRLNADLRNFLSQMKGGL